MNGLTKVVSFVSVKQEQEEEHRKSLSVEMKSISQSILEFSKSPVDYHSW